MHQDIAVNFTRNVLNNNNFKNVNSLLLISPNSNRNVLMLIFYLFLNALLFTLIYLQFYDK